MPGCSTRWDDAAWGDWRKECFHVLGCDVMFDERGKAYLLEVNANPSLSIGHKGARSAVDESVKSMAVSGLVMFSSLGFGKVRMCGGKRGCKRDHLGR